MEGCFRSFYHSRQLNQKMGFWSILAHIDFLVKIWYKQGSSKQPAEVLMDCSPFSQTETLIFWGLAMFFGFTPFWFWALGFESPRPARSHYIKKAGKIVQSGDVMKTDDGKLVAV